MWNVEFPNLCQQITLWLINNERRFFLCHSANLISSKSDELFTIQDYIKPLGTYRAKMQSSKFKYDRLQSLVWNIFRSYGDILEALGKHGTSSKETILNKDNYICKSGMWGVLSLPHEITSKNLNETGHCNAADSRLRNLRIFSQHLLKWTGSAVVKKVQ